MYTSEEAVSTVGTTPKPLVVDVPVAVGVTVLVRVGDRVVVTELEVVGVAVSVVVEVGVVVAVFEVVETAVSVLVEDGVVVTVLVDVGVVVTLAVTEGVGEEVGCTQLRSVMLPGRPAAPGAAGAVVLPPM